jgi:rRNA maturation protein Nop10
MRKKARIDKGPKDETMIANLKNLKNQCTKEGHHVVIELSTPASYSEEEKYYFLTIRNNKKFK